MLNLWQMKKRKSDIMFAKICAMFLSVLAALFASFSPMPEVAPMQVEPDPDFTPVLRFVVSSDSHVGKYGDFKTERIMKMINTGYAAAEADPNYGKLDAAVLVGDTTDTGLPSTFISIKAAVTKVLKDGTDFLAVAAKNHDSYLGRISRCYISGITGDSADFHKVINGYHFIGLSASPLSIIHYTKAQLDWLDEQLAEAVADDPAKPVFVFQHEHIYNTVYGSFPEDTWGVEFFTDILNKYPQVIDISGHSHYPANDPRAIWQGVFTALNDGGLNYYEFTIDGAKSQHPESSDNMAHMLLVEVNAENTVKVRVCDLNAEAVLAEYLIDNVADPVKTKYAFDSRRAAASAPVFTSEPQISVNGKKVTVTTAPATVSDDDVVFIYRLQILGVDNNAAVSAKKLGDYYKNAEAGDITLTAEVPSAGVYTVKLTAEDAWGLRSETQTAQITVE